MATSIGACNFTFSSAIVRTFTYNGVTLADPNPSIEPDAVRQHYATVYPELATGVVEGPTLKAGKHAYSFIRSVGTKG